MFVCLKTRHFKSFALGSLILLSSPLAMASAPQCSAIFLETKIAQAVENLAEMRLDLDLAKTAGSSSLELTLLDTKYPALHQELLQLTGSKEKLNTLIREKIRQLQGLEKEGLDKESVRRAQEQTHVADTRKFKMRVPITFAPPIYTDATLEFSPSTHSVISQTNNGNTVVIDVNTKNLSYPVGINTQTTRTQLAPSGNEIVILSPTHISVYDLAQKKLISHKPLLGPALNIYKQQNLAWNPLRTKIAFVDKEGFAILDVATGRSEIVLTQEELHLASSFFINDHEIMITQNIGQEILIYDTRTGENRTFTNPNVNQFRDFQMTGDGSLAVIAVNNKAVHILDKNSLQTVRDISDLQSAKFYQDQAALVMDKSLPDAAILDFKNPEKGWIQVEGFSKLYSEEAPGFIEAMTIRDGNIIVRSREKTGEFIDIWSIK